MTKLFYADQFGCVIYDATSGLVPPPDILLSGGAEIWADQIFFCSNFNYYGIVASNLAKVISHPLVAGATNSFNDINVLGATYTTTYSLLTHSLGYVPKFMVSYNGYVLPGGTMVQTASGGRVRFVMPYATTTEIRLHERSFSTDLDLTAVSRTYSIVVFRDPAADSSLPMLQISPTQVIFGQGKFRLSDPHMRVILSGETAYAVAITRCMDLKGGGIRVYPPSGTAIDYGPYTGTMTTPTEVDMAIPV